MCIKICVLFSIIQLLMEWCSAVDIAAAFHSDGCRFESLMVWLQEKAV